MALEKASRASLQANVTDVIHADPIDRGQLFNHSKSEIKTLAELGKAAGDVTRLAILRVLKTDSLGVLELAYIMQIRQPALSHHLKLMTKSGLVLARKEGNAVFYRRALPAMSPFCHYITTVFSEVDLLPLCENQQLRLNDIRQQRAEQSQRFFQKNSQVFRQQQEMIADHALYSQSILKLLDHIPLPSHHRVVELGPGEGLFLPVLSKKFEEVLALDNSPVMLEKAAGYVGGQGLDNIECVLGEAEQLLTYPWLMAEQVDCVVANMVLHHVSAPATIFYQAAALLRPGGSLLVSELSAHDQSWVQQSCGDLWLGFSPEELSNWARDAGLVAREAQYLALRNGFQIQIHRFFRPVGILED